MSNQKLSYQYFTGGDRGGGSILLKPHFGAYANWGSMDDDYWYDSEEPNNIQRIFREIIILLEIMEI